MSKATGFLVDSQILQYLRDGFLIHHGTWDAGQIRHASYTLRLGSEVQLCRAVDNSLAPTKQFMIVHISASSPLVLQPGDTARLYSRESLTLPDNVVAFTVARGLLFVEALCPENTYVDPGFVGNLYTTVTNISNRTVTLQYESAIARIFFFKLNTSVDTSYRPGASMDINQQLESIPCVPVNTAHVYAEVTDDQLIESVSKLPLIGPHLQELFWRLSARSSRNLLQFYVFAFSWPLVVFFIGKWQALPSDFWPQVGANLVGGLGVSLLAYFAGLIRIRHLRGTNNK